MTAARLTGTQPFFAPARRRKSSVGTKNLRKKAVVDAIDTQGPATELPRIRSELGGGSSGAGAFFGGGQLSLASKAVLIGLAAPALLAAPSAASAQTTTPPETQVPSAPWSPSAQPTLAYKAKGDAVRRLQTRLNQLGYNTNGTDGTFGRGTRAAVVHYQIDHNLEIDGSAGPEVWTALAKAQHSRPPGPSTTPGGVPILDRYPAYAPETRALFREAAEIADLPVSWADSRGLHRIIASESDGFVGRLNYTYGTMANRPASWSVVHAELILGLKTAKSSATGIGQLLLGNVEKHYPSGRLGIGDPLEEAVGMLRYIKERYGTPDAAWRAYNDFHEGY